MAVRSRSVSLGELCTFVRGVTFDADESSNHPSPGRVPILRAGNIGEELIEDRDLVWVPAERVDDIQLIRRGDIAICMSSGSSEVVGKTARAAWNRQTAVGSFCGLVRPHDQLIGRYLSHFFHADVYKRWRDGVARGASIQNLRFSELERINLALPGNLSSIVERLDTAVRLIRIRRCALRLSEGLLGAVFLEMFGDPLSNPKGWPQARLEEIGHVTTGNTPARVHSEFYGPGIEWIKSDNILFREIHPSSASEQLSELGAIQGTIAERGSSLVVCIAGSENSIGNVCFLDRRVAFNQQINGVSPREGNDPAFVYGLLRAAKPIIQRSTTLAMKRMISKSKLESLLLFKPPMSEQKRFSSALSNIKTTLACQAEALRHAEHLFRTLLHEEFGKGA